MCHQIHTVRAGTGQVSVTAPIAEELRVAESGNIK